MSQLSKFINLVIQFGQKLQSTVNKKYKPFIRSICNLQQLAKRIDPQNIFLTQQLIIFKLGLQAKSTKSIQVSLFYLQKFFGNKFIDLGLPNYCEEFEIEDTTVRKKQNVVAKGQMRTQILKLLEPLIHFKSTQINILLLKVYQYLITEPIAPMLIQLNLATPSTQIGQKILFNYYSYRFYIFQQVYTFTEKQFRSINPLAIRNQKINQQIQAAFVNHQALLDLVHKYVGEMVATVAHIGGKYGLCVICREPADYYCKITKASLCGADCKKRHLQLAEKHNSTLERDRLKLLAPVRVFIKALIPPNFERVRGPAIKDPPVHDRQAPIPVTDQQVRHRHRAHGSLLQRRTNFLDCVQLDRSLMQILDGRECRLFVVLFQGVRVEVAIRQEAEFQVVDSVVQGVGEDLLVWQFLCLYVIGKTSIQLYINFDCEPNKTNIIQRILFQLSKICQDKFASTMYYNKHQKIAIKNGALTLLTILSKGLNQYRLLYPQQIPTIEQQILLIKQRKINLQKFVTKFNQHWLQGLKTLYNMNVVGLQSQQQIVEILLTTKGLRKDRIEEMLLSNTGREYMEILFEKVIQEGAFMGLVEVFRLVPLNLQRRAQSS